MNRERASKEYNVKLNGIVVIRKQDARARRICRDYLGKQETTETLNFTRKFVARFLIRPLNELTLHAKDFSRRYKHGYSSEEVLETEYIWAM